LKLVGAESSIIINNVRGKLNPGSRDGPRSPAADGSHDQAAAATPPETAGITST